MVKLTEEDRALWRAINKGTKRIPHTEAVLRPSQISSPPRKTLEEMPLHIDQRMESSSFEVEKLPPRKAKKCLIEATLDLHGYTQLQAESVIQKFLYQSQKNSLRWVKIITGKSGVLFHLVPVFLKNNAFFISGCVYARPNDGGLGALYVRVRRPS